MTITATQSTGEGHLRAIFQSVLDDAGSPAAYTINPGFQPKSVVIDNVTDRTKLEWYADAAAGTWVKTVAAGTVTLETSGTGATVTSAAGSQSAVVFTPVQNKQYRIRILG